jgi:hypothetical protein
MSKDRHMTHRRKAPLRPRTTLALQGTYSKAHTQLSFEADLAVKYATRWLATAGSLKAPASGIIRRAVVVYAQHLATADPGTEVREVGSACSVFPTSEEEQQMALLRLYACPPGQPLPPFKEIVRSPLLAHQMAELTARAEAVAEACIANRPFGRKATEASA